MDHGFGESRRTFIRRAALGIGLGAAVPLLVGASENERRKPEGGVIVFQGDSITDAGRDKDAPRPNAPSSLGSGYVGLAAAQLLGEHPGSGWIVHNRGISGNKVYQLAERWQEDALALEPDILSILIGVNDFWHTLGGRYQGTVQVYERDYRALLDRTREARPDAKLIIGEPFVVAGGSAVDERWTAFDAYRAAARRVADRYAAAWIPYQEIFNEALEEAPATYWAPDGVHPSSAGNYLMAQAWLEALSGLIDGPVR